MRYWFVADTHFGHNNIIKYDKRPFKTVDEMDEAIITNWNAVVGKDDTVWHLGDFAYRCEKSVEEYFRRLKGHIHIIWGNHDHKHARRFSHLFESSHDLFELKINRQTIVLCHYSMQIWRKSHRGSWHLFGHSHGNLPPIGMSMDVGINCHNYRPISLEEVTEFMKLKIPVSHHGGVHIDE